MASRRRRGGSRRKAGSRRRGSSRRKGGSRRRGGSRSSSGGGKAKRRAQVVANKRKSELKRATNKVRSAKRALRIATRSAGKRKAAYSAALRRAK